ncbi:MAG: hypothetical protein H6577_16060 [Lewinellaceae bacterium]|nr:hypothetical protein [Saprospiraceae bacterium]MCB9339643.1 hypothetical protein [Lewinellaceae bacterium]
MKTSSKFFFLLFFATLAMPAFAKKWRVNNALTVPTQVDFNELKDAVDSPTVSAGDTVYVEGSAQPYQGNIQIFKKLTIIGPGFFLEQANLQPTLCSHLAATIGGAPGITLKEGSSGSYITGLNIFSDFGNPISIMIEKVSNLTITRNRMELIRFENGTASNIIACSNIFITRNIIERDLAFGCYNTINAVYITNNLIMGDIDNYCGSDTQVNILNGTVYNNTFKANSLLWIRGSDIAYNYVGTIDSEPMNQMIHHNILSLSNAQNQAIVASNSTNVMDPYNDGSFNFETDNWTLLPPDQTTTHGAYNGGDPYYSDNPVSPANLPAWPAIYQCTVQPCGDTNIQVQFKVRVND